MYSPMAILIPYLLESVHYKKNTFNRMISVGRTFLLTIISCGNDYLYSLI